MRSLGQVSGVLKSSPGSKCQKSLALLWFSIAKASKLLMGCITFYVSEGRQALFIF